MSLGSQKLAINHVCNSYPGDNSKNVCHTFRSCLEKAIESNETVLLTIESTYIGLQFKKKLSL